MNLQNGVGREENIKINLLKKPFIKGIIVVGILLCISIVLIVGFYTKMTSYGKTTKIGFEKIGELATQTSYSTQVKVTDKSRELFGGKIPFTQTKYIYSYDIVIKAGFNFEDIEWNENGTSIEVKLPKPKILSSEINLDSFKVYHEDESIFTPITLEENNEEIKKLKQEAEKSSIENGLLDNARDNAETILKGFFGNKYDLEKYEIIFKDK